MKQLPEYLRRAPYIAYLLAVLVFAWNLGNQWMLLNANPYADVSMADLETLQKSTAIYGAAIEAIYITLNGILIQLLIAIYDKMKGPEE